MAATLEAAGFSLLHPGAAARAEAVFRRTLGEAREARRRQGVAWPEVEIREVWTRTLSALLEEGAVSGRPDREALELVAVEYECRSNPVWPAAGLRKSLEGLGRACVLGIVSNAQFYTEFLFPALIGRSLRELGFAEELCFWSYRLLEAKPSPLLLTRALEILRLRYGIRAGETLCVGNGLEEDIHPAAEAGCRTALFTGQQSRLEGPEQAAGSSPRPDLILNRLSHLRPLLSPRRRGR